MKTGDQVVQELPWRWGVQGKIWIVGSLGFMFDAWDVLLTPYMIPLLAESDWDLGTAELGLFGTVGLVGMAVGAFVWGSIADALGRKQAFSLTLLFYGVFTLLSVAAPNYELLLLTRFLAGLGLGGCVPVDFAMVSEFAPKRLRGRISTSMNIFWGLGGILCGLVSTALLPLDNWRVLPLAMVFPVFLVFWVRRSVPDSPLYLIRKGRTTEARAVIEELIERTGHTAGEWELPTRALGDGRLITSGRGLFVCGRITGESHS